MSDSPARLPAPLPPEAGAETAPSLFVHPGQLAASATGHVLTTLLGTCVAVCLFDEGAGVGGLNHYLLPTGGVGGGPSAARYGDVAVERLLQKVLGLGARREWLRAKVFGGMTASHAALHWDIGAGNVSFAREWLSTQGIPLVAQDVGGHRGRKLLFDTRGGSAWVKVL